MPRRIATPTPARAGSTTTLGGLSRVAGAELEDRRVRRKEEIETTRRHAREDLETEALQQRMGIELAGAERDIFGVERVGGSASLEAEEPPQALSDAPLRTRSAGAGGGDVGVGVSLPAGRQPLAVPPRQTLNVQPRTTRPLEPARDPTIVHTELLDQEPEPTFDFGSFEQDYGIPTGTLTQAFQTNPVGALNLIIDKTRTDGPLTPARLALVRSAIQLDLQRISDELEFTIPGRADRDAMTEEAETLTAGFMELVIGPSGAFDDAVVYRELLRLFPDDSDEQIDARAERMRRIHTGASEFSGRARGQLEPRR